MRKIHRLNRGQVLIIFVFAIIGLIGITGLAIDGGNIYSDRRHAQNAADTASMAAALTRNNLEKAVLGANEADCIALAAGATCGPLVDGAARDIAATNGYSGNLVDSTVEVHTPPIDGYYSTCSDGCDPNDYIEVIISTNVPTWFARVLGIPYVHNTVEAVALADYSPELLLYGGNTLVELGTGHGACPSDFNIGGSGSVTLDGGGIWVNSSNETCAFKQTSCNTTLTLENGAAINSVGGADLGGCNPQDIGDASPQYPYPPLEHPFAPPAECGVTGSSLTVSGTTTYQPGSYGTFPTVNGPSILTPGVYCVDQLQTSKNITGVGVFIYVRPSSNKSQVDMSGGTIILSPPTTPPYAGYLIFGDWDENSNSRTCTIAGGVNTEYSGMIFVPYCEMVISGNSSSNGISAQIVAKSISLTGTMDLTFKYDESKIPTIPEVNVTGLFH